MSFLTCLGNSTWFDFNHALSFGTVVAPQSFSSAKRSSFVKDWAVMAGETEETEEVVEVEVVVDEVDEDPSDAEPADVRDFLWLGLSVGLCAGS